MTRIIKRRSGKKYFSYYIYVPKGLVGDTQFPFKIGERLSINIDAGNNSIIIKKIENTELGLEKCINQNKEADMEKIGHIPKKPTNIMDIIICPACKGKNLLISKTSEKRRCSHCKVIIPREKFIFQEKP